MEFRNPLTCIEARLVVSDFCLVLVSSSLGFCLERMSVVMMGPVPLSSDGVWNNGAGLLPQGMECSE